MSLAGSTAAEASAPCFKRPRARPSSSGPRESKGLERPPHTAAPSRARARSAVPVRREARSSK
eukprot:scaffold106738_cov43-Phaeocystis_antarctica.AAC.1